MVKVFVVMGVGDDESAICHVTLDEDLARGWAHRVNAAAGEPTVRVEEHDAVDTLPDFTELHFSLGRVVGGRLEHRYDRISISFDAIDEECVVAVSERVRGLVADAHVSVSGRDASLVDHAFTETVARIIARHLGTALPGDVG